MEHEINRNTNQKAKYQPLCGSVARQLCGYDGAASHQEWDLVPWGI